uniref:Uncharacterized protein n=1 Tax=Anguilla anguilla TaxID=7936 RepID=A0A0E9RXJ3_ANGAN
MIQFHLHSHVICTASTHLSKVSLIHN